MSPARVLDHAMKQALPVLDPLFALLRQAAETPTVSVSGLFTPGTRHDTSWLAKADHTALNAFNKIAGAELTKIRKHRNLTQLELASRLPSGVCMRTAGVVERGQRSLTIARLVEFCCVLICTPGDIIDRALTVTKSLLESSPALIPYLPDSVLNPRARDSINEHSRPTL
jgi:DNA-binding Xre family transcriptional regulator